MFLILTVCFFASASAANFCCNPDQWEADMGLVMGTHYGNNTFFTEGTVRMSIDATNGLLAQFQTLVFDGGMPFNQTIIVDDNTGLVNVITKDGCTRHRHSNPLPQCIPDNATESSVRYGLGDNTVNAKAYHMQYPDYEVYTSVTADTCVPFSEVVIGAFNGAYVYETFIFTNVKPGIADRSIFLVPASCALAAIGPPLPGLDRKRAIF